MTPELDGVDPVIFLRQNQGQGNIDKMPAAANKQKRPRAGFHQQALGIGNRQQHGIDHKASIRIPYDEIRLATPRIDDHARP